VHRERRNRSSRSWFRRSLGPLQAILSSGQLNLLPSTTAKTTAMCTATSLYFCRNCHIFFSPLVARPRFLGARTSLSNDAVDCGCVNIFVTTTWKWNGAALCDQLRATLGSIARSRSAMLSGRGIRIMESDPHYSEGLATFRILTHLRCLKWASENLKIPSKTNLLGYWAIVLLGYCLIRTSSNCVVHPSASVSPS